MIVYNIKSISPNITKVLLEINDIVMGRVSFYLDGDKWVCIDSTLDPSIQNEQYTIMTRCKDLVNKRHQSLHPNVPSHNID